MRVRDEAPVVVVADVNLLRNKMLDIEIVADDFKLIHLCMPPPSDSNNISEGLS